MARMMWRANGVRGMGPPKVRLFFLRMDRSDTDCWTLDAEYREFSQEWYETEGLRRRMERRRR